MNKNKSCIKKTLSVFFTIIVLITMFYGCSTTSNQGYENKTITSSTETGKSTTQETTRTTKYPTKDEFVDKLNSKLNTSTTDGFSVELNSESSGCYTYDILFTYGTGYLDMGEMYLYTPTSNSDENYGHITGVFMHSVNEKQTPSDTNFSANKLVSFTVAIKGISTMAYFVDGFVGSDDAFCEKFTQTSVANDYSIGISESFTEPCITASAGSSIDCYAGYGSQAYDEISDTVM